MGSFCSSEDKSSQLQQLVSLSRAEPNNVAAVNALADYADYSIPDDIREEVQTLLDARFFEVIDEDNQLSNAISAAHYKWTFSKELRSQMEAHSTMLKRARMSESQLHNAINAGTINGDVQTELLSLYVANGDAPQVQILIEKRANPDAPISQQLPHISLLHKAALHGHARVVRLLLEHKAIVRTCGGGLNDYSISPLHAAVQCHPLERERPKADYAGCLQGMLDAKTNPSISQNGNITPLHVVAHVDLCVLLIFAGANVMAVDSTGRTPLHNAARRGDMALCRMLLENKANPLYRCHTHRLPEEETKDVSTKQLLYHFRMRKLQLDAKAAEEAAAATVHIFVDNTNINPGTRMTHKTLVQVVEDNRNVVTRMVFGSITPENKASCLTRQCWVRLNYTPHFQQRAVNTPEQFVDDALIAQIQQLVLATPAEVAKQSSLVLLTGDGNHNEGRTTFPDAIKHALKLGWLVEVWSWRQSCNNIYFSMDVNSNNFSLHLLNDYM